MQGALVRLVVILVLAATSAHADEAQEERRLNDIALDLMIEGQARTMGIADRIRIAGAGLCGKKIAPVVGVFAPDHKTIDDMWRDLDLVEPFVRASIERFELGPQPRVLVTVPGLPAATAGLLAGDRVVSVDGKKVRKRVYMDILRKKGKNGIVRLKIDRGGELLEIDVEAKLGCTVPSRFMYGPEINAYAMSFGNITGMYFFAGLLRYLPDDDHLAVIVGHELAHHVLGHTNQPRTSERTEAEADYLGLYFAARAGFDITVAPAVEDALARSSPYSSVKWGFYTHPTSAKRSLEQQATLEEILRKQAQGQPLEPEQGRLSLDRPEVEEEKVEAHKKQLREQALEIFRSHQARIQDVSYRLVSGGRAICGKSSSPVLGATVGRAKDFAYQKQEEVEAAFGVGSGVTVFAVADSSPAQEAGMRIGDRVLRVDGRTITRTKHVFEQLRDSKAGPIEIEIGRDRSTLKLSVPREVGCEFGTLTLPYSSTVTMYHGNKKEILIPTGLARFARDDDELAIAIAHQMGHQLIGRFRIAKNEPRADEIGLRIAAAAGFDVNKAPAFWDRWASEQFWTISSEMDDDYISHGAMSWRAPVIRDTVRAIAQERATVATD